MKGSAWSQGTEVDRFLRMLELDTSALPEASTSYRDDGAIARLAYAYWEDRLKTIFPVWRKMIGIALSKNSGSRHPRPSVYILLPLVDRHAVREG